jgi:poly-gamma-glutamate biosynthesis protein PgsC/CapC
MSELIGVTPGGIVVPGYLALLCDSPVTILVTIFLSLLVFGIAKYILPKFVVLYGRRKFVALMIMSVLFKITIDLLFPILPFEAFELRGIGVIVPALIADCYFKQGVKLTIAATIPTAYVCFGIMMGFYYLT